MNAAYLQTRYRDAEIPGDYDNNLRMMSFFLTRSFWQEINDNCTHSNRSDVPNKYV